VFKLPFILFWKMFIAAIVFFTLFCLFPGCATGTRAAADNAAVVSDNGNGTFEYRRVSTQQREGEAELAVTGAKLESESREIREGLGGLEQSIIASQGTEQELGDILLRVREREFDAAFIEEWRNRKIEDGSGADGKDHDG